MLKKKYFKTKDEVEVTFQHTVEANKVALVSEFNGWEPVPMTKRKGTFSTKVRLPKGSEFHFRYLVDGKTWQNDAAADAYVPNNIQGDNSIVKTY
jgi:1,4-alpha-glucan branching enzyme